MKYLRNFSTLFITGLFSITILFSVWLHQGISNPSLAIAELHQNDLPTPTALAQAEPTSPVTLKKVTYGTVRGKRVSGYLAQPKDGGVGAPGIIAIHEWWGLNDNIKSVAQRLAGEGYQVLAVDLYGGEIADKPDQAKQLLIEVNNNPNFAQANLRQAYNYLETNLQAPKIGSIGWCFGGSWSLKTALLFPQDLDATVIYYGGQIGEATKSELSTLEMPILGIFGAEDRGIPLPTVKEFEAKLTSLGKQADIQIYENADHAFANPSGNKYVPEAAEQAWSETIQFFEEHLS